MEDLELHVFDFDGTLFRSPQKPAVWSGDWWGDIISLSSPSVPENPGPEWWIESTVNKAKESISRPNVLAIMMTGRRANSAFRYRIPELLSQQGLDFDLVHLCSTGNPSQEKARKIQEILNKYPDIKKIKAWDDKGSDLENFKELAISSGIDPANIKTYQVSELSQNPDFNFEDVEFEIDKSKLTKPNYIGIFLDSESKSKLIKEFGLRHGEIANEHITLSLKPFPGMEDLIGQTVKLKVIGYAEDDLGQAVVVDMPPEYKISNKVYHVTISHSKDTSPKYSNELLGRGFETINGPELTGIVDVFPRSLSFEKEITAGQKMGLAKQAAIKKLISIANSLDETGLTKEANELDSIIENIVYDNQALDRWFKEKWVDISRKVKGKHPPCGRPDADTGKYPKCRPAKRVSKKTPKTTKELSSSEKKKAITEKRKVEKRKNEPAGGGARKPKRAPSLKRRK